MSLLCQPQEDLPAQFFPLSSFFGIHWDAVDNRPEKKGSSRCLGIRLAPSYREANDSGYRSSCSSGAIVVVACWNAHSSALRKSYSCLSCTSCTRSNETKGCRHAIC